MDWLLMWLAQGASGAGLSWIIAFTLLTTHITIIGVTVYLHRCQAHRALELHPLVSHFFRFWLWISTGMVTREWVAIHRKHHARCEQEGDPHSPVLFGIRRVVLQGAELYRLESRNAATIARYGAGTPDDWLERHVYSRFTWQGVGLMLVLDLFLFGALGATVWAVQMLWIPVAAAGIVNGVGHYWGYRTFDGPHAATNFVPFGILIGGEELHNNHHTFPTSAKLSVRWFECDAGWAYIRCLRSLGLARVRPLPPRPKRQPDALPVSLETVRCAIACRHHVMRDYTLMLKRTIREHGEANRNFTEALLQTMRDDLSLLWDHKQATPHAMVAHLIAWCERAESSNLPRLRNFSRTLRAYG
jgi:stearoyl-CoA desaturase (delta-9 desaturase)